MITRLTAIEFVRKAESGRTEPSVLTCERPDGAIIEVMAKFSASCDQNVVNLAREVLGACLASDLGLPVPQPFIIDVPEDFADAVTDGGRRAKIKASSPVAFGSRLVTGQFSAWNSGSTVTAGMLPVAAAIFAFDAIIQNPDRRHGNPNCLSRGDDLTIFDHELAFAHQLIIGWRPPWVPGGLNTLETPGFHIFRDELRGRAIDFDGIRDAWIGLSDAQISAYQAGMPNEWATASDAVSGAIGLITNAREHIDGCIAEIQRVLT